MKKRISILFTNMLLFLIISSMFTINLCAATYTRRDSVGGSFNTLYVYSYWYSIYLVHNNGVITDPRDISLDTPNCQHYGLEYGCTISPRQSSKYLHSANTAITYNINVGVYANTALSTPIYVGSVQDTITAAMPRRKTIGEETVSDEDFIIYYEPGTEMFFDEEEATRFAAEYGLSLPYVKQQAEIYGQYENLVREYR